VYRRVQNHDDIPSTYSAVLFFEMTIPFELHVDTATLIIADKMYQLPSLFQLPNDTKYSGPLFYSLFADLHNPPSERAKHVLLTTLGKNPAFFYEVFSQMRWYTPNIQPIHKKRKQVNTQVNKQVKKRKNTKTTMRKIQSNVVELD